MFYVQGFDPALIISQIVSLQARAPVMAGRVHPSSHACAVAPPSR